MKKALSLSLAFVLGLFITSVASAQDKESIPKKALKELDFMAGRWQSEMYENGEKIGTAIGERKWSPEKYCLLFSASFVPKHLVLQPLFCFTPELNNCNFRDNLFCPK